MLNDLTKLIEESSGNKHWFSISNFSIVFLKHKIKKKKNNKDKQTKKLRRHNLSELFFLLKSFPGEEEGKEKIKLLIRLIVTES